MKEAVTRMHTLLLGALLTTCIPIAALAADDQSLSAAAGLTTDNFTLILKIGVPSGLISALLTLIGVFLSNRTAQKNNREKIAAEAENLSRQLNQRQHEFEIQTKMQIESLHSEEKKKVCWDFLATVDPQLFRNKQFKLENMNVCVQPLYLYCKDEYFSYFENLTQFIEVNDLSNWGAKHESISEQLNKLEKQLDSDRTHHTSAFSSLSFLCSSPHKGSIAKLESEKKRLDKKLELYIEHYRLAVEAAKKLIWNEPIEKAQPLQLEDIPDEDDI